MNTRENVILLAEKKLESSEILFNSDCSDDAFYLAGYALELFLKARICKNLNIPNFYDFKNSKNWSLTDSIEKRINEDNLYKPFKVHNYLQLFILSGLYLEFKSELRTELALKTDWQTVRDWDENSRYKDGKNKEEVKSFIDSIKNIVSWLRKYL